MQIHTFFSFEDISYYVYLSQTDWNVLQNSTHTCKNISKRYAIVQASLTTQIFERRLNGNRTFQIWKFVNYRNHKSIQNCNFFYDFRKNPHISPYQVIILLRSTKHLESLFYFQNWANQYLECTILNNNILYLDTEVVQDSFETILHLIQFEADRSHKGSLSFVCLWLEPLKW